MTSVMPRVGPIAIPVLIVLCTAAIYLPRLSQAPVYVGRDEVFCALSARSIAATGRDLNGRLLPLFFYTARGRHDWAAPVLVYGVAAVLKVLPFSEIAVRLPATVAAIADVLIMYFIGRVLFTRRLLAAVAAVLLALTPTHFIHARLASPAQIPGPFVLGWLLCTLLHFRRGNPHLLFLAGLLLAVAAIGYLGPSVGVYVLLTWIALFMRGEAWDRYCRLAAGIALPGALVAWWFAVHPTAVYDILHHYEPSAAQTTGARIAEVASLYWHFWDPRFLFADGAPRIGHSTRLIGAFLLPTAGLLALGILRAVREFSPNSVLLLGGLFSAPLAASFVGEGHAIWRALEVAPFGVLLAVYGLEFLWVAASSQARWLAFVAAFGLLVWLSASYHDNLWHAQALLRAAVAPVAILGLAALFRRAAHERVHAVTFAVAGVTAAAVFQGAQVLIGAAAALLLGGLLLAAVGASAMLSGSSIQRLRLGTITTAVCVALASSAFTFFHVEDAALHRVGFVPASVFLAGMRFIPAVAVVAAFGVLLQRGGRVPRVKLERGAWIAASAVVSLQLGYFYVDYFADPRVRMLHGMVLLLGAFLLAAFLSRAGLDRSSMGTLATGAVMALAAIQFTYFAGDYFTAYQQRESATAEGNVRAAWERVIERAHDSAVPAVYFAGLGPYALEDLFWRFYVFKHHREDLLARTIQDDFPGDVDLDRIRRLPGGSLVVTAARTRNDRLVQQLVIDGDLYRGEVVRAADGTPTFTITTRKSP